MKFFPRWFRRDKISIPPPRLNPTDNNRHNDDVDLHPLPGGPHLRPEVAGGYIIHPPAGVNPANREDPIDPPIGGGGLGLGHSAVPQAGEKEDLYALPAPSLAQGGGKGPRFLGPPIHGHPQPREDGIVQGGGQGPRFLGPPMHGHPDPKPINPGVTPGPRPKEPPAEAMNHQHDQHWWATHGGAPSVTVSHGQGPDDGGSAIEATATISPHNSGFMTQAHYRGTNVMQPSPVQTKPDLLRPVGPNEFRTGGGYGPPILDGGGMTDPFAKKHHDHQSENPLAGLGGDPREGSGRA